MMANKARTSHKGRNGTGDSVTLYFDRSDPAERKALEAARLLATKHGRRKQAIIALLEAVYNHYEATGELLSSGEISGLLMGQGSAPARQPVGFTNAVAQIPISRAHTYGVEVTASSGKASAKAVGDNFLQSMQGLASGFFD